MSSEPGGAPVRVRAGTDGDISTCLEVLNQAYGTDRFTETWFDWKHRASPFGVSRLWMAEGPEGVDGVFFALPWPYRESGARVDGVRTVDGATLPAARGRRVLGTLIRHEYEQWGPDRPGVLVATATETARRSHLHNGALLLPPLGYGYCLVRPRRAAVEFGDSTLDDFVPVDLPGMGTDWSPAALRWRTDGRSGHSYDAARLRTADAANGIVFRVTDVGPWRAIVPLVLWGDQGSQRRLLGAVAVKLRTPVVLSPVGPGSAPVPLRPVRRAGHARVCVWDRRLPAERHLESPLGHLEGWSLGYGELEGLI